MDTEPITIDHIISDYYDFTNNNSETMFDDIESMIDSQAKIMKNELNIPKIMELLT